MNTAALILSLCASVSAFQTPHSSFHPTARTANAVLSPLRSASGNANSRMIRNQVQESSSDGRKLQLRSEVQDRFSPPAQYVDSFFARLDTLTEESDNGGVQSWYDAGQRLQDAPVEAKTGGVQSWYDAGQRLQAAPVEPKTGGVQSWYDAGQRLQAAAVVTPVEAKTGGVQSWYDAGQRLEATPVEATTGGVQSWYDAGQRLKAAPVEAKTAQNAPVVEEEELPTTIELTAAQLKAFGEPATRPLSYIVELTAAQLKAFGPPQTRLLTYSQEPAGKQSDGTLVNVLRCEVQDRFSPADDGRRTVLRCEVQDRFAPAAIQRSPARPVAVKQQRRRLQLKSEVQDRFAPADDGRVLVLRSEVQTRLSTSDQTPPAADAPRKLQLRSEVQDRFSPPAQSPPTPVVTPVETKTSQTSGVQSWYDAGQRLTAAPVKAKIAEPAPVAEAVQALMTELSQAGKSLKDDAAESMASSEDTRQRVAKMRAERCQRMEEEEAIAEAAAKARGLTEGAEDDSVTEVLSAKGASKQEEMPATVQLSDAQLKAFGPPATRTLTYLEDPESGPEPGMEPETLQKFAKSSFGRSVLKSLFEAADKDDSGRLDKAGVREALQGLGFTSVEDAQIDEIFQQAKREDTDGSDVIDFDEVARETPRTLRNSLIELAEKSGLDLGFLK